MLKKHIDEYKPSPYLTFSIHLDGNRERHDASVCQEGVFDKAVNVIKLAIEKGFRVTINCTLFQGESAKEIAEFMDMAMELGVEGVTISPGYSYERAPKQDVFLKKREVSNFSVMCSRWVLVRNGVLINLRYIWIFLLAIKLINVLLGVTQRVMCLGGKNHATY